MNINNNRRSPFTNNAPFTSSNRSNMNTQVEFDFDFAMCHGYYSCCR